MARTLLSDSSSTPPRSKKQNWHPPAWEVSPISEKRVITSECRHPSTVGRSRQESFQLPTAGLSGGVAYSKWNARTAELSGPAPRDDWRSRSLQFLKATSSYVSFGYSNSACFRMGMCGITVGAFSLKEENYMRMLLREREPQPPRECIPR